MALMNGSRCSTMAVAVGSDCCPPALEPRQLPRKDMPIPITLISSMATRQVLAELARAYAAQSGCEVALESVGGVDAARRLQAGEAFDAVVLAQDALAKLVASGHVVAGSCVDLVRSPVAVAVRAGAPRPDVASEAALRRAVAAATQHRLFHRAERHPSGALVRALGPCRRAARPHRDAAAGRASRQSGGPGRDRTRVPAAQRTDAPRRHRRHRHAAHRLRLHHHLLGRPVRGLGAGRRGAGPARIHGLAGGRRKSSAGTAWSRPCGPHQEIPLDHRHPRPLHHRTQGAGGLAPTCRSPALPTPRRCRVPPI